MTMKRWCMGLLIVGLALVIIGTGLTAIGYTQGGRAGVWGVFTGQWPFFKLADDQTLTEFSETYTSVKSVRVDVGMMDISVIEGDAFSVEMLYFEDYPVEVELRDGVLTIKQEKRIGWSIGGIGISVDIPSLIVTVPGSVTLDELDLENGVGECRIGKVSAREFNLETGTGDITIENLSADSAEFSSGVGEVVIRRLDAGDVSVDVGTGDAILETVTAGKITAELGVGTFRANDLTSGSADISTGTGDVRITGTFTGMTKISSGVGEVFMTVRGAEESYNMDLHAGVGDLKVNSAYYRKDHVSERGSRDTLKIEGGVGDVIVEFVG